MRQEYLCVRCGVESHVDLDSDGSVYENCERIRANHQKRSPECTGDLSTIKLLNGPQRSALQPEQQSQCCSAPIVFVHDSGPLCTKCNKWTATEEVEQTLNS